VGDYIAGESSDVFFRRGGPLRGRVGSVTDFLIRGVSESACKPSIEDTSLKVSSDI
jgi:hypothetical protein